FGDKRDMTQNIENQYKQQAARLALERVKSGMRLGLGTGSTTAFFVDLLGQALQNGELHGIVGAPTSERTRRQAEKWGIPLASLDELQTLDLAVDGADEIDPQLDLIKGLGKALLREKIVEIHAQRFVVIADESKLVRRLGAGPLPVEIVQFEAPAHVRWLGGLADRAELWRAEDGSPFITDNGNFLARLWFETGIADPYALANALAQRPGIVEHGLFLGMATEALVAGADGIRTLRAKA
ncbi:MAG TPA: ribose-5-phosphate isomerase RpiA, partial [Anaerolineales bacterium]|nr:ribose-5-phosphate isomerase RpiA [Anaerolineales bacterium]